MIDLRTEDVNTRTIYQYWTNQNERIENMSNYVEPTVNKYSLPDTLDHTEKLLVFDPLCGYIDKWASRFGYSLTKKELSGSRAKGTAITLSSDLDIFASLSSTTTTLLATIYYPLRALPQNLDIPHITAQFVKFVILSMRRGVSRNFWTVSKTSCSMMASCYSIARSWWIWIS